MGWADFDKSTLEFDKSRLEKGKVWRISKIEILLISEYEAWLKEANAVETAAAENEKPKEKHKKLAFELLADGQVRIGEKFLHFRGTLQFALVKQLLATGLTGRPVKLLTMLADSGFAASVDSLSKAFKNNPSWPLLQPHIVHQQGFVQFVIEAKS